jgi:hypothetical protein
VKRETANVNRPLQATSYPDLLGQAQSQKPKAQVRIQLQAEESQSAIRNKKTLSN